MRSILMAFRLFIFLTLITGIAYPLFITGIGQLFFSFKSNGSIILKDNQPVGSLLIGQSFDSSGIYFYSRPSAVSYNPLPSGGANYGLTSKKLRDQSDQRKRWFIASNQLNDRQEIPSLMVFASASGLDPHISPEAAMLQASRICNARNFSEEQKTRLMMAIDKLTEPPQFLFLGQKRINVLLLNLETDKIK